VRCRIVAPKEEVIVEFFGIPRARAGRAELGVAPGTIADVLTTVEEVCPGLTGLMKDGGVSPHYLVSVNGESFGNEMRTALKSGDRLLLLSADAGG
jgi:molybdopterin converting factor small subunit